MKEIPSEYMKLIEPFIKASIGFLNRGLRLIPLALIGEIEHGKIEHEILTTENYLDKDKTAKNIQKLALKNNADFIFVILESWQLKPKESTNNITSIEKYNYLTVKSTEFRDAFVSFILETKDGMWVANSKLRPLEGTDYLTINLPIFEHYSLSQGRFAGLLLPYFSENKGSKNNKIKKTKAT